MGKGYSLPLHVVRSGGATKCRLAQLSHRETYWSRIKRWILRNFQTLIVSAVKLCKQCLQTASGSWGLNPQTLSGASTMDPTGGLPSPDHLGYSPLMKIPGAPLVTHLQYLTALCTAASNWIKCEQHRKTPDHSSERIASPQWRLGRHLPLLSHRFQHLWILLCRCMNEFAIKWRQNHSSLLIVPFTVHLTLNIDHNRTRFDKVIAKLFSFYSICEAAGLPDRYEIRGSSNFKNSCKCI